MIKSLYICSMQTMHKYINSELKAYDNVFKGYAALWESEDLENDVFKKGSIKRAYKSYTLLFNHNFNDVVGKVVNIKSDDKGLLVEFDFVNTDRGKEVKQWVMEGAVTGLSIGFVPRDFDYKEPSGRVFKNVSLIEVSLVSSPANPDARIFKSNDFYKSIDIFVKAIQQHTDKLVSLKDFFTEYIKNIEERYSKTQSAIKELSENIEKLSKKLSYLEDTQTIVEDIIYKMHNKFSQTENELSVLLNKILKNYG